MPAQLYTGIETPDVATLTIGTITYQCTVWVDVSSRSVESEIVRVQDNGAEVVVSRQRIYTVTADFGPDDPRIIASRNTFVVHWLEGDLNDQTPINPVIRKATIDMSTFGTTPTWTNQSTLAIARFMHALQPVLGHAEDYLVAYVIAGDLIQARRQDGYTWIDNVWIQAASGGNAVALRAIGCYAHDTDDEAIFAYERVAPAANQVWCTRLVASTGLGAASAQSFTTLPTIHLWQARFARYAASSVALVVEVNDTTETNIAIPILAYVRVSTTTANPVTDEHRMYHVRMLGEPFTYAAARETDDEPNLYVLAGFKNAEDGTEYAQAVAFVLNLDIRQWSLGGGDNTIRGRQVSTFNLGDFDCRVTGYTPDGGLVANFATGRRVGHVSHAALAPVAGRAMKTRTWSVLGFAKLMAVASTDGSPLQPVAATVQNIRFQVEEPTQLHRDSTDPPAPSECFRGENPFTVGEAREAAGGALLSGGTPAYYDGTALVELGYTWTPEILAVADSGAGAIGVGTYLYCITWEQRDRLGQLHRSAPSALFSHDAAANQRVQVTCNTLTTSMRDNVHHYPGAAPINAVLWRTEAGGVVLYRVFANRGASNEPHDTAENDPSTDRITMVDNVPDAELVNQETLPYQLINGAFQPLPPFQPPAASAIAKWQNRVFLASSQDSRLIYFSQEMLPEPGGTRTLPPEFHPSLVIRIDGLGRVVAMQEQEVSLVVFTSDAIYAITGLGPDGSGNGSSYQVSVLSKGVGCIDQRSIVHTPGGTFFQSWQGLKLLLPGGQIQHLDLGKRLIDTIRTGGNLRGGAFLADRSAVRWVTNGAPAGAPLAIELDLETNRWSTHPLALGDQPGGSDGMSAAVGCTAWVGSDRSILFVVVQQGALLIERAESDANPYADENRSGLLPVLLEVEFQPIHLDGISGYTRVRRLHVALEKPQDSGMVLDWYAWRSGAYDAVVPETRTWSSPAPQRLRWGPRVQKCTAFWITIREGVNNATENVRIVGFQVEVGAQRSLGRR